MMLGEEQLDAKIVKTDKDFVGLQFGRMLPAGKARLSLTYSGQFSKSNTSGLFKQKGRRPLVCLQPVRIDQRAPCLSLL
ncbi:hypothetical protein ACFS07_14190 [Undibacterium arcticum]